MKVLYVTHFFPPEKGAAANRSYRITKGLVRKGIDVDILTGFPNYPDGKLPQEYRLRGTTVEYTDYGAKVIRVPMQPAASADPIWFRLINQISFPINALLRQRVLHNNYDVVIASSPPLFTGLLGYLLSEKLDAKFVLDVRDLWPESIESISDSSAVHIAAKPFRYMAKFLYSRADLITSPVNGILKRLQSNYGVNPTTLWVPNGIFMEDIFPFLRDIEVTKSLVYTGLLGRLQDNISIVKLAEQLSNFKFFVAGDGAERDVIEHSGLDNLEYLGVLSWEMAMKLVAKSGFGIAFFKHVNLMKDAIPSKIIEYAALGKPVVMNIDTEASNILKRYNAGVVVESGDINEIAAQIRSVWNNQDIYKEKSIGARKMVKELFDMESITSKLVAALEEIL